MPGRRQDHGRPAGRSTSVNNAAYLNGGGGLRTLVRTTSSAPSDNIYGYMFAWLIACHLQSGASIINTGSIIGLVGNHCSFALRHQGAFTLSPSAGY
jgi:hypothetical protein